MQNPEGGYDAWNISFSLMSNGVEKGQLNCIEVDGALPNACLAAQGGVTYDNKDSVMINYLPLNVSADATAVELRVCYSKADTADRPWRKVGDTIAANLKGQCQYKVEGTTTLDGGSITYTIPSTMPDAAMFVRAFTKCGDAYCGVGNSDPVTPYLFLAVKMNTTPPQLVAAVAICASIGPVLLIGYLLFSCFKSKSS